LLELRLFEVRGEFRRKSPRYLLTATVELGVKRIRRRAESILLR
jgi:hypothetical protein